ncbi:MAG: lysylphosphatidylglycerol synthase transmembrane domain-containing protein [Desulforhopalus sp.]
MSTIHSLKSNIAAKSDDRKKIIWLLKSGLGVSLLMWLLVRQDNWIKLFDLFGNFHWNYLFAFAVISFFMIWISCLKWNLFLKERGVCVSTSRLFGLYVIGIFFNNFFPGNLGGDVVKSYLLGRQINSQSQSVVSIVLERFTGLIALVGLCIGVLTVRPGLLTSPLVAWAVLVMAGACVGFLLIIYYRGIGDLIFSILRRWKIGRKISEKLEKLRDEVTYFKGRPKLFCIAMVYSFMFHISTGVFFFLSAHLIGLTLDFYETLALTPIILLVNSVPLTPNNLGVLEWACSVFLMAAGGSPVQGLAIALVIRAKNFLVSLIGWLLFLAGEASERRLAIDYKS